MLGLLAAALEAGSDALVGHLLRECDLPGWLASAPLWVTPLPREGDPRYCACLLACLRRSKSPSYLLPDRPRPPGCTFSSIL